MFAFPIAFFSSSGSTPPAEAFENYYSNEFDGLNDYVDLGTELNSMFELGDSFSISVWIKFGNTATDRTIVANMMSGTLKGFQLRVRTNEAVRFVFAQTPSVWLNVDTSVLAIDTWHHIVATYDGSNSTSGMNIYVNGSLDNDSTGGGGTILDMTSTDSVKIGKYTGGQFYAGKIDEVAIFDSELSASDVTAIYNSGSPDSLASQSNLKGWWRMGDGANYPIIKNQAHFSQTALDFDGSNDYVDLGRIEPSTTALSISFWLYVTNSATSQGLVTKYSSTDYGVTIWGGGLYFFIKTASWDGISVASYLSSYSNQWVHVCCTWDGSTRKIYLNGTEEATGAKTGSITYASNNTRLGNLEGAGGFQFGGNMDDVSFYDVGLSASDVTDIYNSGYPKDESERSGLVAYYKFDGDTYPVVRDALQFSNASLDFDGVDDYVDAPISALNSATDVTISMWFKLTATNDEMMVGDWISANSGIWLYFDGSGHWFFSPRDGSATNADYNWGGSADTNWHHIVGVYDAGATDKIEIYFDGVSVATSGTAPSSLPAATGNNFEIGGLSAASAYSTGNIDDVSIYSSALSSSDVTDIYNSGKPKDESSTSNLVGYWRMGDNTISPDVPSALGYGTHSVAFDGTNDYVDLGDVLPFERDEAFSISAWVYLTNTSTTTTFFIAGKFQNSGNYSGYALYAYNYKLHFVLRGNSDMVATSAANLTPNQWHHIVGTYDGSDTSSGIKTYINGSLDVASQTGSTGTSILSNTPFIIGSRAGGSLPFQGNIAEVAVFDSELSASDVTALYNSGLPKDLSSESDLVSYWRMGDGEDKFPNILDYKGTNHGTMTNMASDNITTANVGAGTMTNMASDVIVADSPAGTSGQMTNMASDNFVAAKDAGTMTNMDAEGIVASTPS